MLDLQFIASLDGDDQLLRGNQRVNFGLIDPQQSEPIDARAPPIGSASFERDDKILLGGVKLRAV